MCAEQITTSGDDRWMKLLRGSASDDLKSAAVKTTYKMNVRIKRAYGSVVSRCVYYIPMTNAEIKY